MDELKSEYKTNQKAKNILQQALEEARESNAAASSSGLRKEDDTGTEPESEPWKTEKTETMAQLIDETWDGYMTLIMNKLRMNDGDK